MTKILVVEDEREIREEIVDMLLLDGYEVIEADDGDSAAVLAREELPELIISDIMMPEIDGFELFRILKEDSITASIPFIFLSALSGYSDVRQGMELGADDYLTKPFDYHQLINAVQARLRKHSNEEFLRFRQLAGHLISDRDKERNDLANVLQDQVLETLNGLYFLQNNVSASTEEASQQQLRDDLAKVIRNTQSVIYNLQPILLGQLSVASLIQWLALQYERNHGLKVSLQLPAMELHCTEEGQRLIFNVVDEALSNCQKHAETDAVRIVAQSLEDSCRIEITDGGKGFDLSAQPAGVGIQKIREQARYTGAFVRIASSVGHGTRVTLHLPRNITKSKTKPLPSLSTTRSPDEKAAKQGQSISVIIADDHEVVSEGLASVISDVDGFHVDATAATTPQLFDAIKRYEPAIVIIDATFERSNGLEAVYSLKMRWPLLRIIVLSPYDDAVYANEVLRQGVNGFLLKNVRRREVATALSAVISDKQYVSPELQDGISMLRNPRHLMDKLDHDVLRGLTFREREVFYLVLDGQTSPQIGESLNISTRTVETHRRNLMKKLDVKNINEIHRFANRHGLMKDE